MDLGCSLAGYRLGRVWGGEKLTYRWCEYKQAKQDWADFKRRTGEVQLLANLHQLKTVAAEGSKQSLN